MRWIAHDPFSEFAFERDALRPNRCLIVLDSFALPFGVEGKKTRSWFGLWDEPIFAWAGLWREIEGAGSCFLGAVTRANPLVSRAGPLMPLVLDRLAYQQWLFGKRSDLIALWRQPFAAELMWLEQTDELWGSGRCLHEVEAWAPVRA
jgi:putative SOS response-associated peptidase YedK